MRSIISILIFNIISIGIICGQTFTNSTPVNFAAVTGYGTCMDISVSGLSATTLTNDLGLTSVTVNITHPNVFNIRVKLVSPNGSIFTILDRNTCSGANYVNTVLSQSTSSLITSGTSPYTGTFRADKNDFDFCQINKSSENGNGTWQVCVDYNSGNVAGTINSVTLDFGANGGSLEGTNVAVNDVTGNVPMLCTLDQYKGSSSACYQIMNTSGTNLDDAVSPIGINNNSWVSFTASATTVNLNIEVSNCYNQDGVQFVFLSTNDFVNFTPIGPPLPNPFPIGNTAVTVSGLTPGNVYYLMADGYAGDVCEYFISAGANSGVLVVNATTDKPYVCNGDSAQLDISGNPATVNWTPATGLSNTTIKNPKASPAVTTEYTVTATTLEGCNISDTITIFVPLPVADPTAANVSNTDFCIVDVPTISLSAIGGTGDSLVWYTGSCGGTKIGIGNPLTIASPTQNTTYYARWETACDVSNCVSIPVTIKQTLFPPTSAQSSNVYFCQGSITTIDLSATGGVGDSLVWYTGSCGGTKIGRDSPLTITAPTQTTTYYARWEGECGASTCASVLVKVSLPTIAPVSVSVNDTIFCFGTVSTVTLSATGGQGDSLVWFTGSCGGTIIGTASPLTIAAPADTTTYYARWEGACGLSSCDSVDVTVKPTNVVPLSINVNANNFCEGTLSIIDLSITGGIGDSLSWYIGSCGGTKIGMGNPLTITAPTDSTKYYVRWEGECGNTTCLNIPVNVIPLPLMPIATSSINNYAADTVTNLVLFATDGFVGDSLVWYTGSCGATKIGGSDTLTIAAPRDNITYYVRSEGVCGQSACDSISIVVIKEYALSVPSAFTPSSNNVNNKIYVRGKGIKELLEFTIYNRWGQIVFQTKNMNDGWDGTYNGVLQNTETYIYVVSALMLDNSDSPRTIKGNITLLK